jgi:thiol-disulfide isomerase/thioredoxin
MTHIDPNSPLQRPFGRWRFVGLMGCIGLLIALALFLYGKFTPSGKEEAQINDCLSYSQKAHSISQAIEGEVAAFTLVPNPKPFTDLSFNQPDGTPIHLSELKGKWLLLNIWATWCIPCREEIPALDVLEQKLGGDRFEVVTLNIDTAKLEKRSAFFSQAGVKNLRLYADPSADVFQILRREGKVLGLPTTFLLSPDLCHIGTMQGGGNWASPEALGLIRAAVD